MSLLHEALDRNSLNKKRRRWLEFHDQKTGGIMGLLPLIKGLPVRLTDHIDRNLGLYKQTKCTIHGWTLNINEASAKNAIERVLDFQPDMIYLKFENAKWRVHDDLDQGVYPDGVENEMASGYDVRAIPFSPELFDGSSLSLSFLIS